MSLWKTVRVPLLERFMRAIFGALLTVCLVLVATVAQAQDGDEERLEELKAEREQIQADAAAQASLVDAATASADAVAVALDQLNAQVDLQEARLADAARAVAAAEALVALAEQRRGAVATEIRDLENTVAVLAIEAFVGDEDAAGNELTDFLTSDDPSEAARRRSLVEFQTGNLADSLDRLAALSVEIELIELERLEAVAAAERFQSDVLERTALLDDAYQAQVELVLAAESRLEARLAEAEYFKEIDAEVAADIRAEEEAIAKRIREEAARRAAAAAAQLNANRPPPAGADDMVNAEGFFVHRDVADAVGRMIRAARADGVELTGYSFRSPQRTAELRVINGCPDVYTASPSSCRIPTARPGTSMHERGLAIDFRSCWRGSDCFTWLSSNAASYGYFNLPSESWHWSTNGR